MLVPLKKWRAVQGVMLLLSTLAATLGRLVESVLPTGAEFSGNRLLLLPVRSVGARTRRVRRFAQAERGGPVRGPARSQIPATRASFRSRDSV